jgi:hypothetical protein
VKDPVKEDDKPSDLASPGGKDSMNEEQEEMAKDASEEAKDAAEEEKEKDDESKEARDRRRARDKRAGARDARKAARDARMARDAKLAKDADKDKGMDAAEITALVRKEIAAGAGKALDAAEIVKQVVAQTVPAIRKEEAAKASLYGRLSPIVGAFDHAEMTHADMAAYGLDKLGAQKASDPIMALDYLLAGRAQVTQPSYRASAQDSSGEDFVSTYLKN